jgi:SAM-dependent methyltransferase
MADPGQRSRGKLSKLYTNAADAYKNLWAPELLPLARELLPHLSLDSARAVLEAGAGVGQLLPDLQGRAPRAVVVGADLSFGMLRLASREFPRVVMDASRLAFKDESVDAGILAFVLFHLYDPQQGVAEIARVLRRNGFVGTATWGDVRDPEAYEIWFEELASHGAPPPDSDFARFELVDTPDKVEAMMKNAGLHPVRSWVGEYKATSNPKEFLAHRTGHGQSRLRYEAMPKDARSSCLERARNRLECLGPEGFEERAEVVFVVGRKGSG